jgi:hypothetical protein
LGKGHHTPPLGPIQFYARSRLLEGTDNLITGALCERRQIALLTRAGLIASRNAAVDSDALSQLNSSRWTPRNPLFLLGHEP